jgi:hypothetical protein
LIDPRVSGSAPPPPLRVPAAGTSRPTALASHSVEVAPSNAPRVSAARPEQPKPLRQRAFEWVASHLPRGMASRLAVREMRAALQDSSRAATQASAAQLFSRLRGAADSLGMPTQDLFNMLPAHVAEGILWEGIEQGTPEVGLLMSNNGARELSLADNMKSELNKTLEQQGALGELGVSDDFIRDFGRSEYLHLVDGDMAPIMAAGAENFEPGVARARHNLSALKSIIPEAAQLRTFSALAHQHTLLATLVEGEQKSIPEFLRLDCVFLAAGDQKTSFTLEAAENRALKVTATLTKSASMAMLGTRTLDVNSSLHFRVEVLIQPTGEFTVTKAAFTSTALEVKGVLDVEQVRERDLQRRGAAGAS